MAVKFLSLLERHAVVRLWALSCLGIALAGCGRDDVHVYWVDKEKPRAEHVHTHDHAHDHGAMAATPRLEYETPDGWLARPAGAMRVASFAIPGPDGHPVADMSVIPLPGMGGRELDLVNLWRGQVQLPPVTEEESERQGEPVAIGADTGKLFDLVSAEPILDDKYRLRVIVAMTVHDDTSWFFKLTGEDALVTEHKPRFLEFLKSVAFHEDAHPVHLASTPQQVSTNVREAPEENSERPIWVVPPGWQEQPSPQMLLAKFVIRGTDDKTAELNVSMLSGTGGGLLANVNRWRRQINLPAIDESELKRQAQPVDVTHGRAVLVDISGTDVRDGDTIRVLGAIVAQSDRTWFYKLTGDTSLVEREKEIFRKFVETIDYPHAH
jgi:hypothetical protein